MKRLMIIVNSLGVGGIERTVVNISNYLSNRGWDVFIVKMLGSDNFYKPKKGINIISLNSEYKKRNIFYFVKTNIYRLKHIYAIINRVRPHAVISMGIGANVLLATLKMKGIKVAAIGSERSYPSKMKVNFIWKIMRKVMYRKLDALVVLTPEMKEWFLHNCKVKHITVIPNFIDRPIPSLEPKVDPDTYFDNPVILAVGRMVYAKGFDLLIEAFATVSKKHPNWRLVIVGDGPLLNDLKIKSKSMKLDDKIFFPGLVGNLGDWYSKASIYVMSSRYEGFGNVLLEAMSYGCPVVAFDCKTGPSYIVRNNIDGILVPEGDVNKLAEGLLHLIEDESKRNFYSKNAIDVIDRFSPERIMVMWDSLINAESFSFEKK